MNKSWRTKLIHSDALVPEGFQSLVPPTHRGSTTVFPDASAVTDNWDQYKTGYTYGLYGTPTTLELAGQICELEHGYRTLITPSGQCAILLVNLAFLSSGDHILIPENIYLPNRKLASFLLKRFGVECTYYQPSIGAEIERLMRPNTRLVWCESPGSITMEVQDIPAISQAAHRHDVLTVVDNTWSAGVYFDALAHGADIITQALTKYVGGHCDLLLGSVTVKDETEWQKLGAAQEIVGCAVSPDDCSLALRGMKTLGARLDQIERSALFLAKSLSTFGEIECVLHPALRSCPGHEFWRRDFTGSSGLFSIVLKEGITKEQVLGFVNSLRLFKIGFSWGGVNSLVMAYDLTGSSERPDYGYRIIRLSIGLEDRRDLLSDIQAAMKSALHK
jgi:cysteine-S-conjugate beta-lyase